MLNEWSPYPDMLLSAWKMNEYVPTFLVEQLSSSGPVAARQGRCGAGLLVQGRHRRPAGQPGAQAVALRPPADAGGDPGQRPPPGRPDPRARGRERRATGRSTRRWTARAWCSSPPTTPVTARRCSAWPSPHRDTWVADIWNVGQTDQIFYQALRVSRRLRRPGVKALLTGGSGFLGSALCRDLVEAGHEVVVLDDNSRGRASRLTRPRRPGAAGRGRHPRLRRGARGDRGLRGGVAPGVHQRHPLLLRATRTPCSRSGSRAR